MSKKGTGKVIVTCQREGCSNTREVYASQRNRYKYCGKDCRYAEPSPTFGTGKKQHDDVRQCKICGEVKPLNPDYFYINSERHDGYRYYKHECNICSINDRRERRNADIERAKERERAYYHNNKEKVAAYQKKRMEIEPEKVREAQRRYRENNIELCRERNRLNSIKNRETVRKYRRNRYANDAEFKILHNLRSRLLQTLKGRRKEATTVDLLGCSVAEVKHYLEEKFTDGMTWANYGEWHIDHIVPCASFDLTDPGQQAICFHYTNLQPLWAKDNLSKGDTVHEEWEQKKLFKIKSGDTVGGVL